MPAPRPLSAVKPSPRLSKKERTRAKKAREALPRGMSRDALLQLWLMARRHHPEAQTELHRLLTANPKIQQTLKEFVDERESIVAAKYRKSKAPAPKPEQSAWERMSARATRWAAIVSGGLPSLGKRR